MNNQYEQLKLLAIFAIVVEQSSFAAAARKLSSSRSRVSEQVAKLEQMLQVRLLQRSTRKLSLTIEGEQIYQHALKLDSVLKDVEATIDSEAPSGRVTLTVNHDIAHKFILPKLGLLKQRHPQINLDLILEDQPQDLIMEHIDLAIRVGVPKDSSLIARPIHKDRFGLFASPEFLQQQGVPESLEQLQSLPWIALAQIFELHKLPAALGNKTIEIKPKSFELCNSPFMVQQMVLAGLGISLLLPSTVRQEIETGRLIRVLPEITGQEVQFAIVYPSRKQLPKRTQAVIDFLLEQKIFQ